jgi:hypothetical protein
MRELLEVLGLALLSLGYLVMLAVKLVELVR